MLGCSNCVERGVACKVAGSDVDIGIITCFYARQANILYGYYAPIHLLALHITFFQPIIKHTFSY